MEIDQKDATGNSPHHFLWLEEDNRRFIEPDELFDQDESERDEPSQPQRRSKPKRELLPAILERQLIERWQKLSDVTARNRVFEAHLGLVGNIAKKYSTVIRGDGNARVSSFYDEAFQAGCLGLFKAIAKFDLTYKNRFSTYAEYWIRAEIGALSKKTKGIVRRPRRPQTDVWSSKHDEFGNPIPASDISLDAPINFDDGDGNLHEVIAGDGSSLDEDVEAECASYRKIINRYLDQLNDRERHVVSARFLHGRYLAAISRELGITPERVRQIGDAALKKISRARDLGKTFPRKMMRTEFDRHFRRTGPLDPDLYGPFKAHRRIGEFDPPEPWKLIVEAECAERLRHRLRQRMARETSMLEWAA